MMWGNIFWTIFFGIGVLGFLRVTGKGQDF